jgi:hypothetical protein
MVEAVTAADLRFVFARPSIRDSFSPHTDLSS